MTDLRERHEAPKETTDNGLEMGPPDALMLDTSMKKGESMVDRVRSISLIAEPILGVDYPAGERAQIRILVNGKLFITKSVHDTIQFPLDHDLAGRPRYRWLSRPDGSQWGYLVEGALPGNGKT